MKETKRATQEWGPSDRRERVRGGRVREKTATMYRSTEWWAASWLLGSEKPVDWESDTGQSVYYRNRDQSCIGGYRSAISIHRNPRALVSFFIFFFFLLRTRIIPHEFLLRFWTSCWLKDNDQLRLKTKKLFIKNKFSLRVMTILRKLKEMLWHWCYVKADAVCNTSICLAAWIAVLRSLTLVLGFWRLPLYRA